MIRRSRFFITRNAFSLARRSFREAAQHPWTTERRAGERQRCPHNSDGTSEQGEWGDERVPRLFEGLCRFRNELIHEDGADLLSGSTTRCILGSWRVVLRVDFLFPLPRGESRTR